MIDILLAFDEEDDHIGSFNQGCKEDYEEFFIDSPYKTTFIGSRTLNSTNVQMRAENLRSFIFVAYSHGEANRLYSSEGDYISTTTNIDLFENAFFYTVSCYTGNSLGSELIIKGCRCYFGYRSPFNSWRGYKNFSECANFGLFKFVEGESTNKVYDLMIKNYNNHIDDMYKDSFLQAALLRHNRDGLVKLGEDISISSISLTS